MKSTLKSIIVFLLTLEAQIALWRHQPQIIAVTGSVGKTGTKDAIYALLRKHFHTGKSEKSFNSEIGLPLTILGLKNPWNNPLKWMGALVKGLLTALFMRGYPEVLVLEVGADHPGDIEKVGKWLRPDVVVVTSFGDVPVHVEFFPSTDALIAEKAYLVRALKPHGLLVVNRDDDRSYTMKTKTGARTISYGYDSDANIRATNYEVVYADMFDEPDASAVRMPRGFCFRFDKDGASTPIRFDGAVGKHHAYPLLAALAVGDHLGMNAIEMAEDIFTHRVVNGRGRIIEGVKNSLIIDDSYNSSPVAVEAGLVSLSEIDGGLRKVCVLGDMLELGKHTASEHKRIGFFAASVCDIFVTVGVRARGMAEGALTAELGEKNILQFDDSQKAGAYIQNIIRRGDIVYVKGSQGVRLEKTVEEIMAYPEDKRELLVRQDREWERR